MWELDEEKAIIVKALLAAQVADKHKKILLCSIPNNDTIDWLKDLGYKVKIVDHGKEYKKHKLTIDVPHTVVSWGHKE